MTEFPERNWNNSYETSVPSRLPPSGNKFSSKVLRRQKMANMHSGLFIFAVVALESVTINLISLFPLKIKLCMCVCMCAHIRMHVHGMHMGMMCGVCAHSGVQLCVLQKPMCACGDTSSKHIAGVTVLQTQI